MEPKRSDRRIKRLTKWIIGIAAACILIFIAASNLDVILSVISNIIGLFMPLIVGVIIAVIINVPMSSIEKRLFTKTNKPRLLKLKRPLAIILAELLVFGIFMLVAALVIPELINAVPLLANMLLDLIDKLATLESSMPLEDLPFGDYLANFFDIDWNSARDAINSILRTYSGDFMNTALGTVGSVAGGLLNFVVGTVFSIYSLFHKEKLQSQARRLMNAWLPSRISRYSQHVASVFCETFKNFITAQTTEALILGSLCAVGMMILRLPYVPMISALVGVTALIPVIGAFIGTIVGAFMILAVDPIKTVIFVIFLLVLQQIEGNLIYPKVVGASIRLPAMWVLAAVTVGGSIGGPLGMLIGVPTASALYTLVREATEHREMKIAEESGQLEAQIPPPDSDTADTEKSGDNLSN